MPTQSSAQQLVALVEGFAKSRSASVSEGSESPRLAATFVDFYGRGMAQAAAALLGLDDAGLVKRAAEAAANAIDPDYADNKAKRTKQKPADFNH